MDLLFGAILGVLSSFVASVVFWVMFFKISRTDVRFSDVLVKSESTGEYPGAYRYRVKIINAGHRDLIEVSLLAKVSVKRGKVSHTTYLGVGNESRLPVLRGAGYRYRNDDNVGDAQTLTLYPNQAACHEFRKSFYDEPLRAKAAGGLLSLEDLFEAYGENITITIFIYGNDARTGARKMFTSRPYTIHDTAFGAFGRYSPGLPKNRRQDAERAAAALTFTPKEKEEAG